MPTVLLSYRREDAQGTTGRIFDRLAARYGRDKVFMDVDSIPFGANFRDHIRTYIEKSDVVLVIIGPNWNVPGDNGKRRLSNPKDWVRIEIETAIEAGISLIPVCVDGASIPAPKYFPRNLRDLPLLNAAIVHPGRDFESHVQRLIREVERLASRRLNRATAKPGLGRFNASIGAPQPTLEEILGSIRRVVADHESTGNPSLVSDKNERENNGLDEEDIFDLVNELDAPMAMPGTMSAQLSEKVAEFSPEASREAIARSDPNSAGANSVRTPLEEAALILNERMTAIRAEMSVHEPLPQPHVVSPKAETPPRPPQANIDAPQTPLQVASIQRKVIQEVGVPGGTLKVFSDSTIELREAGATRLFRNFSEFERYWRQDRPVLRAAQNDDQQPFEVDSERRTSTIDSKQPNSLDPLA